MERRRIIGAAVLSAAIAGGGVAGVILGSPASGSAATSAPTTTSPSRHRGPGFGFGRGVGLGDGPVLDAAAKALGITTDTLRTDLKNGQTIAQIAKSKNVAIKTVTDAMVAAAKKQLASQEAEIESHLDEMIDNLVNGTFKRPTAPKGENGPHRGFGFRGGFGLDAAAKAIGVSTDTLEQDLKNGQTIAQVAKSKNVATQKVIDAMVAAAKAQFDAAVKAGHMTADQRTKIEANLTQMITNQVNGTFPKPSFGGRGPGGFGGPGFGGGFGRGGNGNGGSGGSATQSSAPTV